MIYANLQAIVVGIPLLKPDLSLVDHEIKPDGSEKISGDSIRAVLRDSVALMSSSSVVLKWTSEEKNWRPNLDSF